MPCEPRTTHNHSRGNAIETYGVRSSESSNVDTVMQDANGNESSSSTTDNSDNTTAKLALLRRSPIYGYVLLMEPVRWGQQPPSAAFSSSSSSSLTPTASSSHSDALLVVTDRLECCALLWDPKERDWQTAWSGRVDERCGRTVPALSAVDPRGRAIAIYVYQGRYLRSTIPL